MALVDLVSDLSKYRSTVKSVENTTPETSKVKDSKSFGAVLPITEKLSSLSPTIQKQKETPLESKLTSTGLDDIVKNLQKDLTINSVSRYSAVNASPNSVTIGRVSIEKIVSKFSNIRQEQSKTKLNKSDTLVIKKQEGTNNLTSDVKLNTTLPKTFDRKNESPNPNKMTQTEDKSISSPSINKPNELQDKASSSPSINKMTTTPDKTSSSPDIFIKKNDSSDDVVNPKTVINKMEQTDDKSVQSPNVFSNMVVPDKEKTSPSILSSKEVGDKTKQSPNVFPVNQSSDRKDESPDVLFASQTDDKSKSSPDVLSVTQTDDKSKSSPNVLLVTQTDDKSKSSPDVFSSMIVPDKSKTSPNINIIKDDAKNNITNPNVDVFGKPMTFDRQKQSVLINKDIVSPINNILNPDVKLDLNILTYDRTSQSPKIQTKNAVTGYVKDPKTKVFKIQQGTYHLIDESRMNLDGIPIKFVTSTRIGGRQSGLQKDNRRYDLKSKQLVDNSNYNLDGVSKTNPSGRNENPNKSKFSIKGIQSVNFFKDTNATGFKTFATKLKTDYVSNSSEFTFKSKLPNPVNFITDTNATGFTNKVTPLVTSYKKDTSKFTFKGSSKKAPAVNYFPNINNTGFTDFAQPLKTEFKLDVSRFGFKGNRQSAPSVNYFVDVNSSGFGNLPESLKTNFNVKTSRFTWVGNKQQAPEVDFFKIPGPNPGAVPGFTKLFTDKTQTKLTDNYSQLSFWGTTKRSDVKPVPFTKFLGFRPGEPSGFMVGMTGRESSLYPILEPRLFADSPAATRLSIETQRAAVKHQRTVDDLSKYVPTSMGGLPWFDGKDFGVATLGNQVPFIKTKVAEGYGSTYFRKYERLAKDSTDGVGYLGKWAITRHSPSPLDQQYEKYSLPEDAFNPDPLSKQPYVVRGIQKKGSVENQRWGFGVTFDDGIVRGGAVTQAERILQDTIRIGKWSISTKGLLWNAKQIGLQLMNPVVDTNPDKPESGFLGVSATQIFNPLSIPLNVATARAGLHLPRHGLVPFSSNFLNRYEDATIARENKNKFIDPDYRAFGSLLPPTFGDRQTNYNRLIGLMKELLPNSFQQVRAPSNTGDQLKNAASRAAIDFARKLTGQSGIIRLSSNVGGAQSFLGIGGTQINRAKHPYLTHYTTTPLLMLTGEQKEPQYQSSAKRDTFYAATSMYKDLFSDLLRTIAYNLEKGPYEINDENLPRNKSKIENLQPSTIDRIVKQNPFNPQYDLLKNRLRNVSATDVQRDGNISDGVNPKNNDVTNPIKQYRALAYDKLGVSRDRRRSRNSITNTGDINDFREDLMKDNVLNTFSTDPSISDYANQNLEDKFGFGKHGKANVDKSNPSVSNIQYGRNSKNLSVPQLKKNGEFRGDRINIIDYKRGIFDLSKDAVYETGQYNDQNLPGAEDLIEFYFTGLTLHGTENTPAEAIVFRATFGAINDTHNAEWTPIDYMGRADPLYVYKGYTRQISFDFTIQVTSRDEMKAIWRKINHLASWTAPTYTKAGFMKAPLIRLNIGHMYRKMPGFLSSIEYSVDNTETTWETAQLKNDMTLTGPDGRLSSPGVLQLPKTVKVSCNFTPIGMYRPEYNGVMYSLFDDSTGGGLENGLIPTSNTKVNYFRSYEVDNTGNEESSESEQNKKYYRIKPGDEAVIPEIQPEDRETLA